MLLSNRQIAFLSKNSSSTSSPVEVWSAIIKTTPPASKRRTPAHVLYSVMHSIRVRSIKCASHTSCKLTSTCMCTPTTSLCAHDVPRP